MTHFYDYPQTVELINGLNSVSTLKKWRLKIERLTGHAFEESRVRTGKRSYSKVTLFTNSDIEQLQQIANLKGSLGLEKAILKVYAPNRTGKAHRGLRAPEEANTLWEVSTVRSTTPWASV